MASHENESIFTFKNIFYDVSITILSRGSSCVVGAMVQSNLSCYNRMSLFFNNLTKHFSGLGLVSLLFRRSQRIALKIVKNLYIYVHTISKIVPVPEICLKK